MGVRANVTGPLGGPLGLYTAVVYKYTAVVYTQIRRLMCAKKVNALRQVPPWVYPAKRLRSRSGASGALLGPGHRVWPRPRYRPRPTFLLWTSHRIFLFFYGGSYTRDDHGGTGTGPWG